MITFFEFFGTLAPLGVMMLVFFIRVEHRLTQIETKLDAHLEKDCERDEDEHPAL